MRVEEARAIKSSLDQYANNDHEVLLNIGSSTDDYRVVQQPHIDNVIFSKLDSARFTVVHFDLKKDQGVDISGDIFNPEVQDNLQSIKPSIILCCNLLEHLVDISRNNIPPIINNILSKGGVLIMSVPFSYPLHFDPIDTYFRPTPQEISKLFPNYDILEQDIIRSNTFMREYALYSMSIKIKTIIRLLLPIYKFKEWICLAHRVSWLFRSYKVSYIVLRKR